MVRDAEANKEDDKKFHELVGTRNKADQLVHATRAAIKEHGGKVDGAQIGAIESALSDLEKVMKGEDKDAIDAKIAALEQAAQALAAAASAGGAGRGAGGHAGGVGAEGRRRRRRVHRSQRQEVSSTSRSGAREDARSR